jgi:release factor glutamine methyltransferase
MASGRLRQLSLLLSSLGPLVGSSERRLPGAAVHARRLVLRPVPPHRATPRSAPRAAPLAADAPPPRAASNSGGDASATVGAALRAAIAELSAASVPEPSASAEHMLAHVLGSASRGVLVARADEPLGAVRAERFREMVAARLERKPVQYILGEWDFLELTLAVRPPVLVPRPETEELVLLALERCAALAQGAPPARVLDVGCGSGAIGLAVLHRRRAASCLAIDVSTDAVALAKANAASLGLGARYDCRLCAFAELRVRGEAGAPAGAPAERFDVLLSNPPYIPARDMPTLEPEVARWEDERALCGGADGMDVIGAILSRAAALLRGPGCEVWLEVDPSHPPLIRRWVDARPDARLRYVETVNDLGGFERFVRLVVVEDAPATAV